MLTARSNTAILGAAAAYLVSVCALTGLSATLIYAGFQQLPAVVDLAPETGAAGETRAASVARNATEVRQALAAGALAQAQTLPTNATVTAAVAPTMAAMAAPVVIADVPQPKSKGTRTRAQAHPAKRPARGPTGPVIAEAAQVSLSVPIARGIDPGRLE